MIHAAALDVWWHDIDTLSAEHPQLSWMVGETTFVWSHSVLTTEHLPRQARDNHSKP